MTSQPIDFDGPFADAEPYRPASDRILAGDPVQRVWNLFSSADGRFHSGLWACERGKWRVVFTESEFCHLLEGVIVVTSEDGAVHRYEAGDAFVSPAGFTGIWEVLEPARKRYAIYE
ncbi:MAG: cupin domain-containing protein [Steroidobacteraceae bacterium]